MKKLLLLLILPLFLACSKDNDSDNDNTVPESEKIAVTANDIIGRWEYTETKEGKELKYDLYFSNIEDKSWYSLRVDGSYLRYFYFNYSIDGFKLHIDLGRGSTLPDTDLKNSEIFKRGGKLYFNNMPFAPLLGANE